MLNDVGLAVEAEIGRISAGSAALDIENPVRGLFVDPTGRHAIISTHPTLSDPLYLQRGFKKPRPLSKAKVGYYRPLTSKFFNRHN